MVAVAGSSCEGSPAELGLARPRVGVRGSPGLSFGSKEACARPGAANE
jgi:hypothetical protein